jgi:acyl-CoA hydrolase
VEDHKEQERSRTTDAYYTFVAVDPSGEPQPVPDLQVETPAQQELYEEAKAVKEWLESR